MLSDHSLIFAHNILLLPLLLLLQHLLQFFHLLFQQLYFTVLPHKVHFLLLVLFLLLFLLFLLSLSRLPIGKNVTKSIELGLFLLGQPFPTLLLLFDLLDLRLNLLLRLVHVLHRAALFLRREFVVRMVFSFVHQWLRTELVLEGKI